MGAAIGMDTEELFNDEDLDYTCASNVNRSQTAKGVVFQSFRSHTVSLNYISSQVNKQIWYLLAGAFSHLPWLYVNLR